MSELTITDITNMGGGKVCIAGQISGRTARLNSPNPTEAWVKAIGILGPGSVISVRWQGKRRPECPHVEDGDWDPRHSRKIASVHEDELAGRLTERAVSSVREAFGEPWFLGRNGNAAFRPGEGGRSLATLRVSAVSVTASRGTPRVTSRDASDEWQEAPLQDLPVRVHFDRCKACPTDGDRQLKREFEGGPALLRIGLTRTFRAEDQEPACWLQVNHIFLTPSRRNHFTLQDAL